MRPGFFGLSPLANHFPSLHGARVLAIILVVQFHVTGAFVDAKLPINIGLATLSWSVFFGMDLFFILSGFLIGTMILHAADQGDHGGVWRFYARRAFRIFPLYYVTLGALLVLYHVTPTQWANLPYELVYLTNYRLVERHTVNMMWGWSLCVEEHFYLVVPFFMLALARLRSDRGRLGVLALLFFSALAVRLAIYLSSPVPWNDQTIFQSLYIRTHTRYDTLVAGIALAYLQRYHVERIKAWLARPWVRRVAWAYIFVSLWVLTFPHGFGVYFQFARVFLWGTVTSLMYLPLLLLIMNHEGPLRRFLSHRAFLKVATLGYGIYLWHIPVAEKIIVPVARRLMFVDRMSNERAWLVSLVLLMVLSVAAAYVTHILVEKPALWLRDRLTGSSPAPGATQPAGGRP